MQTVKVICHFCGKDFFVTESEKKTGGVPCPNCKHVYQPGILDRELRVTLAGVWMCVSLAAAFGAAWMRYAKVAEAFQKRRQAGLESSPDGPSVFTEETVLTFIGTFAVSAIVFGVIALIYRKLSEAK